MASTTTTATSNSGDLDQQRRRTYGLLGEFPGDDALLKEVAWCHEAYLVAPPHDETAQAAPPLARLVSLLGRLPLKGRHAVVRNILAQSPHRDAVLKDLFNYCFEQTNDDNKSNKEEEQEEAASGAGNVDEPQEEDDEFVVIAYPRVTSSQEEEEEPQAQGSPAAPSSSSRSTPPAAAAPKPLNLAKFHIFQTVLVLMAVSGKAGADASRRYLNETASTRYCAKILIQAATCFSQADFSNQELYDYYKTSPRSVQTNLINVCCQRGGGGGGGKSREGFLRLVYESSPDSRQRHPNLIYHLDSDYLASQLDTLMKASDGTFELCHWGRHGDVYIDYIRRRMQDCRNDQLELGNLWQAMVKPGVICKSLQSRHVFALLDLLQEYTVCGIRYFSGQKYLQEMSARGEDVSKFEGVVRYTMVSHEILKKLTQKERMALALKYIDEGDMERFHGVVDLCPHHELPYESFFASLSVADFWRVLSDKVATPWAPALGRIPLGPERSKFLQSWTEMHQRCKPTDLTDEEMTTLFPGRKTAELWAMWFRNQAKLYDDSHDPAFLANVLNRLSNECTKLPILSPSINVYARLTLDVLDAASVLFDQVSSHIDAAIALRPLLGLLGRLSFSALSKSEAETTRNVSERCIQIICDRVLPFLRDTMQFDRAAQTTYISQQKLNFFESSIGEIADRWASCDKVAASLARTVLDVHTRVSKLPNPGEGNDFVVVTGPPPDNKQKFAWLDFDLHKRVKRGCYQLGKKLLKITADVPSFERSLAEQLWVLVRDSVLSDGSNLSAYLYACKEFLPGHLAEDEQQTIVERSAKFILSAHAERPATWKTTVSSEAQQLAGLGVLEAVLENETAPATPKIAKYLLVEYGGFASEKARQSLKDETFAANADERVTGLTVWLTKACETDSSSLMAEAFSFAATRIKNESGIHRRTIFTWLESFVEKIVRKSLEDSSGTTESHKMLCSALLDIQKNDLSRLDSVGRRVCFPKLPKRILETVLRFDPSRLCRERRQLWADCAVQIDWNLKTASGDEGLARYEWPLDSYVSVLESAQWIPLQSFEAVYPASRSSSAGKITRLGKKVSLSTYLRANFDRENVFGPVQCVEMLESAIGKVWTESLPSCALRLGEQFPEDEDVSDAWLERILVLYRLCGRSWQDVELLTTVFDRVIGALRRDSLIEEEFLRAHRLLKTLLEIHSSTFYLVPELVQACDKLFRCSVAAAGRADFDTDFVGYWLPQWRTAYLESDRREWECSMDDRLQHFVDLYAHGCEPDVWRPVLSKSERVLKECRTARELLQMSPDALLLEEVRNVLFSRRQDVLLSYVQNSAPLAGVFTETNLHGLFEQPGSETDCIPVDELLFRTLDDEALLSSHADVSIAFARFARAEASNSRLDLKSKTEAISLFMGAPSTQHVDVLAALQSDLDDAVRESLLNQLFSLDSPWHILGYMLNKKALAKNDQRITSSLLRYVAQHVHIEKVVRVAGLLLKNPRRKGLRIQLHKQVVRMLFSAKSPEAMRLLGIEWTMGDLPDGVRSLIAEKCVQEVNSGASEGWEAAVLSDIATSAAFPPELKFWILAVEQANVPSLDVHKPVGVEKDELLDQYRLKGPPVVKVHTRSANEKFRVILQELERSPAIPGDENGTLQLLAKLRKWALAPASFVDEMSVLLTNAATSTATDPPDHATQVTQTYCAQLLAREVVVGWNNTVQDKNMERNSEPSLLLDQFIGDSNAADKFRACMRALLNAALDIPARQEVKRGLVLHLLDKLVDGIRSSSAMQRMQLFDHLAVKPFEREWKLLKTDTQRCRAILDKL